MKKVFFLILVISAISCEKKPDPWIISTPDIDAYTSRNPAGKTVIPNGRIIQPAGQTYEIAPHPFGLTLSPDGQVAVTANSGTSPLSITIIKGIQHGNPEILQVPPGPYSDEGVLASVFMGLAISPDNGRVYVSGGQENKIFIFDLSTGQKLDSIDCSFVGETIDYSHGYLGDLVLTRDGKKLLVVDQINFRVVIVNTETRQLEHNIPVGRYPFGITLSPDEKKAYVANVGMFEYKPIKGIDMKNLKDTGLNFPPFGFGTEEAEQE